MTDERSAPGARMRGAVTVLLAVVGVVGLGVSGLGLIAWWLVPRDAPPPTASSVAGASTEAVHDGRLGYAVWAVNADGTPVRWDPCSPIDVVLGARDAPAGAAADVEVAVERLVAASGLDLRYAGTVDERPASDREAYQPDRYGDRWAPVLVAWAAPGEGGLPLRDVDRGLGMPVAVGPPGDRTYVTGQVVLNVARHDLVTGFDDREVSWGATLLHELAHVLGLAHVDDPGELMHVYPGRGPVTFGPGDRAGLAAVGAELPCRTVPRPQPVEVSLPRP